MQARLGSGAVACGSGDGRAQAGTGQQAWDNMDERCTFEAAVTGRMKVDARAAVPTPKAICIEREGAATLKPQV